MGFDFKSTIYRFWSILFYAISYGMPTPFGGQGVISGSMFLPEELRTGKTTKEVEKIETAGNVGALGGAILGAMYGGPLGFFIGGIIGHYTGRAVAK